MIRISKLLTISRIYAETLFSISQNYRNKELDLWINLIRKMEILLTNPDVRIMLLNPILNSYQKIDLLSYLIKVTLPDQLNNFISFLIKKKRIFLLSQINQQLQKLKDIHAGITRITVLSAFPLQDSEMNHLILKCENKFNLKIRSTFKIKKSLIGGIQILIKDQLLDFSIQSYLVSIYKYLKV